jgi:uncharacterized protein with HEPN domain
MKACCERVNEYTTGLSRQEFENKRMAHDATLRELASVASLITLSLPNLRVWVLAP